MIQTRLISVISLPLSHSHSLSDWRCFKDKKKFNAFTFFFCAILWKWHTLLSHTLTHTHTKNASFLYFSLSLFLSPCQLNDVKQKCQKCANNIFSVLDCVNGNACIFTSDVHSKSTITANLMKPMVLLSHDFHWKLRANDVKFDLFRGICLHLDEPSTPW